MAWIAYTRVHVVCLQCLSLGCIGSICFYRCLHDRVLFETKFKFICFQKGMQAVTSGLKLSWQCGFCICGVNWVPGFLNQELKMTMSLSSLRLVCCKL